MADQCGLAHIELCQNTVQIASKRIVVVAAPWIIGPSVTSSFKCDASETTLDQRRSLLVPCSGTQSPAGQEYDRAALPSNAVENRVTS